MIKDKDDGRDKSEKKIWKWKEKEVITYWKCCWNHRILNDKLFYGS